MIHTMRSAFIIGATVSIAVDKTPRVSLDSETSAFPDPKPAPAPASRPRAMFLKCRSSVARNFLLSLASARMRASFAANSSKSGITAGDARATTATASRTRGATSCSCSDVNATSRSRQNSISSSGPAPVTSRASSRRVASEILDVHSTTAASSLRAVSASSADARASVRSTDSLSVGKESATSLARRRAARRTRAPNSPASLASSAAIAGESATERVVRARDAAFFVVSGSPTLGVTFSFAAENLRSAPPPFSSSAPAPRVPRAPSRGTKTCSMSCSSASSDGPELASAPTCTRASMSSARRRASDGESLMKYAAGADAAPGGSAPATTRSAGPAPRSGIGGASVGPGTETLGSGGTGSARARGDEDPDPSFSRLAPWSPSSFSVPPASPPSAFGA